jgi:hypothetical protein
MSWSLRYLPALIFWECVNYKIKGAFQRNSVVKNLVYITLGGVLF